MKCLSKFDSISWEYTLIQINRWAIIRQYCPKEKLDMGRVRNKMGEHLYNAKQQENTSAHHTSSATHSQIKS